MQTFRGVSIEPYSIRIRSLCCLVEQDECTVSHVQVGLVDDLERRVHGEHGHADVNDGDAAVCHILGNGAAAAQVIALINSKLKMSL